MDDIEYAAHGNTLQISIKRPAGLRQKRSEASAEFQCSNCSSTNVTAETNGAGYVLACMDCPNYNTGAVGEVLDYTNDEEAYVISPDYFEEV